MMPSIVIYQNSRFDELYPNPSKLNPAHSSGHPAYCLFLRKFLKLLFTYQSNIFRV